MYFITVQMHNCQHYTGFYSPSQNKMRKKMLYLYTLDQRVCHSVDMMNGICGDKGCIKRSLPPIKLFRNTHVLCSNGEVSGHAYKLQPWK